MPGGQEVGARNPGAGTGIRTVSPTEFDGIKSELLNGAKPIQTPTQYGGQWYQRPDGTEFGIRQSDTGPVIDINKSNDAILKPGYKVHRK